MHHEGDGRMSKSIWAHEPILTSERKLWRAVLVQAFVDAEMTPIGDETGWKPFESARQYLRADNFEEAEHLKLVCDFADVPADRVILWARQRYAAGEWFEKRMECGSGAAAFLTAEESERSEKREVRSRTPQNAVAPA
jgi:hypothetical protein